MFIFTNSSSGFYSFRRELVQALLQNAHLRGTANAPRIGAYDEGVYMMKYNELLVKKL